MVVPVDSGNGVRKYVWDNVTTDFSYPYIIESESLFANLYNDNGELVLSIPSTAYTLSDPTRSAGVLTITDSDVLETEADSIILERIEELNQELDLGKRDFPPQDIEDAFDKSRIIDQQQQALTNRGVITNITENRQEPIELPPAVQDLFLAWDDEGNLKNATSTGTPLPTVPNTYLKRNNDNTAFDTLTSSDVITDIGAIDSSDPDYNLPSITANTYLKANSAGDAYEAKTVNDVESDLGVDTLKSQVITGYFHVRDEKPDGTNGGTSVAGIQTRELNKEVENSIAGASLSSNQITLPVGKYKVKTIAPCRNFGTSNSRFYNVTDAVDENVGGNIINASNVNAGDSSELQFILDVSTSSKVFELRHYIQSTYATSGLGTAVNSGTVEVYSDVFIEKIGG